METKVKILVTGSNGFIGKNLVSTLKLHAGWEVMEYDRNMDRDLLEHFCRTCDCVIHLAGINRPQNEEEYLKGNTGFTKELMRILEETGNSSPVILTSSIQADEVNPYGRSKKLAEEAVLRHAEIMKSQVFIYRLPNIFGKWAKPDYNSVVATFCYHIARGEPIKIHNPAAMMELVYIDDLVAELICVLKGKICKTVKEYREGNYSGVSISYHKTVGEIAESITEFAKMNDKKEIPDLGNDFMKKLYSTYLSFLPHEKMKYNLTMNCDLRGSFTEMLHTKDSGQLSVNISKPHIIKGNHWHHTKHEKFLVVSGEGVIRLRMLGEEEVIRIQVSGKKLELVEIPPGYIHNIENIGEKDMVTVMWANEIYCPDFPDTYYQEV